MVDDPDKEEEFALGEAEEDVYTEEGREDLEESDEISNVEEGFMQGWEEESKVSRCANCKKVLREDKEYEEDINGKMAYFCSEECAEIYKKKKSS